MTYNRVQGWASGECTIVKAFLTVCGVGFDFAALGKYAELEHGGEAALLPAAAAR